MGHDDMPSKSAVSGRAPTRARVLGRQLASGLLSSGGWSFVVATAGVNGLNFLFHVVISRLLGPSHYGALGALLNLIAIMMVPLGAVQLAVTQAVVARGGSEHGSLRSLGMKASAWGLGTMALFWGISPLLDGFLKLKSPSSLIVLGLWVPLAVAGAVLQGALMGELRFVPVAIATFLGGGMCRLVIGVIFVVTGLGVAGAVAATVVGQGLTTLVLAWVARRYLRASERQPIRISMRDAALSIAALSGYTALTGIDTLLARHFLAAAPAGRYAAASIAGHIALFLPGALVMVAFPRLARDGGSGRGSRKTLAEALGFVTVLGFGAAGLLAAFPSLAVKVLFGSSYLSAAPVVGVLALASALLGLVGLLTYFHIARRSKLALVSVPGLLLVTLLVSVLRGGMWTIALSTLITSAVVLVAISVPAILAVMRSASKDGDETVERKNMGPAEPGLVSPVC
ncbi:MAG: oligosaccharide flippase family protein [Acidimicrobiales bacterium]